MVQVTAEYAASMVPARKPDAHKGELGHLLVVAGSVGFTGAAHLTCEGALRSGVGLVTLGVPRSLNAVMEVKTTEAMTLPLPETDAQSISPDAVEAINAFQERATAVAVGPGLSTHPDTAEAVRSLLPALTVPMVVDADGLNALAQHVELVAELRAEAVLTPHPGEMSRLTGMPTSEIQANREKVALNHAQEWGCTVVLKGAGTVVASPAGDVAVNTTGNSGLASGGSGDVLTGLIGGLLAQRLDPWSAATLGVYVHGSAGDIAAETLTPQGMTALDVVYALPAAWRMLLEEDQG